MKKIILLNTVFCCLQFCIFSSQAQTLYGTTSEGGSDGGGTINKFTPATNSLVVVKSFESLAYGPVTNFIQASDGKLYGMTSYGGNNNHGVIFSFDPTSSTYTKLKNFDGSKGANPFGSLMRARDGKLYGMTSSGGISGAGVIFSFDPSASIYTKLHDFDFTNGRYPNGSLIEASDGKLYGMTYGGGISDAGVIFSFDPSSSIYTNLRDFDLTNGGHPYGSLLQASDGKLYGMTHDGGSSELGVIFSFDPSSSTYIKLKDFDGSNGASPYGSLIQAKDGKLYGMAQQGGIGYGVIFSFDPSSSIYITRKDFDFSNGANPNGSLMQASDGKLYGMTSGGGSIGNGVIFSFNPSSSTYTRLNNFEGGGASPLGSLMEASDGKLYGMTNSGYGVIFFA